MYYIISDFMECDFVNKNKIITFRVNEREEKILMELCNKYGKKPSSLLIFLLEKEYYFSKEDDNNGK
jgi:hypothetical protein